MLYGDERLRRVARELSVVEEGEVAFVCAGCGQKLTEGTRICGCGQGGGCESEREHAHESEALRGGGHAADAYGESEGAHMCVEEESEGAKRCLGRLSEHGDDEGEV